MRVLERLLRYLKRHPGLTAISIASLLIGLAMQLTIPLMIRTAIDDGISGNEPTVLVWAALAVVGLTALQGIFHYGRSYLLEWLAQQVVYDLRNDIFQHLQRLSFNYYDQAQTGQLITKVLEDTSVIRQFFGMAIRSALITVLLFVGVSVALISLDWQLALATLFIMPIIAYIAIVLGVRLRPIFRMVQDRFGAVTAIMQDNLAGARVVRAFAREEHEMERFAVVHREFNAANMRAIRIWSIRFGLLYFLSNIATIVVLIYGGWRVITGASTIGTITAFITYLVIVAEPIRNLGMIINVIARAVASGERVFEILDTRPDLTSKPEAIVPERLKGHVVFDHVGFAYRRDAPVLHDINIDARPGSTIALFGLTGAGKSTIASLIPRFYDVTKGRVLIDGIDVCDLDMEALRRNVGIVMQETLLFSATIRENIAFGRPDATEEEIVAAAKAARAHDFISRLPEGYDSWVGERGVNLSGGQKQRLAIARAILINPPVLIFDDATSSVDTETEFLIQQALDELMESRTTFVIAQRLVSLKRADEIIVLDHGRIVQRGTHDQLLKEDGLYRDIYDLQLRDQEQVMQVGD